MSNAIATWVVAFAGIANLLVYIGLWFETRKQNAATRESLELARAAFLESNKPSLAVSAINCKYFGDQAHEFVVEFEVQNCGTSSAVEVQLGISFNATGFQRIESIGPVTIQPQFPFKRSFAFPMKPEIFRVGQMQGNLLRMRIDGSYKGIDGRTFSYGELHEYDPRLTRFVAIHTG
jgi:hypothetical protein